MLVVGVPFLSFLLECRFLSSSAYVESLLSARTWSENIASFYQYINI